jgi:hypothetical protein
MPRNYPRGLLASIGRITELDLTWKVKIHVLIEVEEDGRV